MGVTKLLVFFLICTGILFTSCSKETSVGDETNSSSTPNEEFNLTEKLTVTGSTEKVTSTFLNMGVTKLNIYKSNKSISYKMDSEKSFSLNGVDTNMADYEFSIKDGVISLVNFPEFKVTLKNEVPYFISPIYEGLITEIGEEIKNHKISLLLLFLVEVTSDNDSKLESKSVLLSQSQPEIVPTDCPFWNTYYVYTTGVSRSVAIERLKSEVEFRLREMPRNPMEICYLYGGIDVTCLKDDHGCIATQAICCVPRLRID